MNEKVKTVSDIVFLKQNPTVFCVSFPFLFAGLAPSLETFDTVNEENEDSSLREISSMANKLSRRIEGSFKTYFHFEKNSKSAFPILCCVLRRQNVSTNFSSIVRFIKTSAFSAGIKWTMDDEQKWMIENYKPPIKVIFCGDRNTAVCFESVITFELKALPEDSVVFHGGCKGIDLYVEDLAKGLGIETKEFRVTRDDWNTKGLSAGPQRNQKMLEEIPSYVVAFHPDISMSKGTRDMMNRAWSSGIPVYIHDLKRKGKFEGDFSVL
jgi:hypothetical protein